MQRDMWSGWGIRTLSSDNPSFNPYNYQTGAVWPHDSAIIAMGMRRFGFTAEGGSVGTRRQRRRKPHSMPVCSAIRQAFPCNILAPMSRPGQQGHRSCLQAMLGLEQDAPRGELYLDPALPDWLPDVTLIDLRLGRRRFDIRFWREGKDTVFEVLKGKRDTVERKAITPFRS